MESSGIDNFSVNSDLDSIANSSSVKPQYVNTGRLSVKFSGNFMKQTKVVYPHGSVINVYIAYELKNRRISNPELLSKILCLEL